MCMRPPHFKAEGKKWNQVWLITGLAAIALTTGTAPGQITIRSYSFVRSLATGSGGFVSSGDYLPVFNSTLQAIAISGDSVAVTDGMFISSPGYALLRIDLDQVHSELLGGSAFAVMNIVFDITESMAYDLTGQYVYLGNESAHVDVSLGSGGCIYCGSQLMSSPTTAIVGMLPLGTRPDGPTTGVLASGGVCPHRLDVHAGEPGSRSGICLRLRSACPGRVAVPRGFERCHRGQCHRPP